MKYAVGFSFNKNFSAEADCEFKAGSVSKDEFSM